MVTELTDREAQTDKHWSISVHPVGEVLVAQVERDGLGVALIIPGGAGAGAEAQARLDRIVADAFEAAAADTGPRRTPAHFHHTMDGLTRWGREILPGGEGLLALLVSSSDDLVAIGHFGGSDPQVLAKERSLSLPWFTAASSGGVECRAAVFYAGRLPDLELSWMVRSGAADALGASVEARLAVGSGTRTQEAERPAVEEEPDDEYSVPDDDYDEHEVEVAIRELEYAERELDPAPPALGAESALDAEPEVAEDSEARGQALEAVPEAGDIQIDPPAPASVAREQEHQGPSLVDRPSIASPIGHAGAVPAPVAFGSRGPAEPVPEEAIVLAPVEAEPARRAVPPPVRPMPMAAAPSRPAFPWRRAAPWAAGVALLFAVGWLLGQTGGARPAARSAPSKWTRTLRAVGLGGAWADVQIESRPAGAWIAVDGKSLALRTPATVEIEPGVRNVTLSLDGLGQASYQVEASNRQHVPLHADLRGALRIDTADPEIPIAVEVDGEAKGYAPLELNGLEPGPHVVEFAGPGMPPWNQTIEVGVRGKSEVIARAFDAPETGVIEVRAQLSGRGGPEEMDGAAVWVDGVMRGSTPLKLELPRGPHSIRIARGDERPPVQVIDLPGGNQRFATFSMGTGADHPTLEFNAPPNLIPADHPVPLSVSIEGVELRDVRQMWLHVRSREGLWRRYAMTVRPGPGCAVGMIVFPAAMADPNGRAVYYASAMIASGDEYFTEIRGQESQRSRRPAR